MFVFNCTQNFKDNICSVVDEITDDCAASNMLHWVVHSFQIKRKNCVVAMHVMSRYSILFANVKKIDSSSFFSLFMYRLYSEMNFLCGLDDITSQGVLKKLNNYSKFNYCKSYNRSVQAHINDVIVHFKDQIEQAGRLPKDDDELFSSGYDVNRFLRSTLEDPDYFYPEERMVDLWRKSYVEQPDGQMELSMCSDSNQNNKVVSLADYKKNKDLM